MSRTARLSRPRAQGHASFEQMKQYGHRPSLRMDTFSGDTPSTPKRRAAIDSHFVDLPEPFALARNQINGGGFE
jgi:hypothetical protein